MITPFLPQKDYDALSFYSENDALSNDFSGIRMCRSVILLFPLERKRPFRNF